MISACRSPGAGTQVASASSQPGTPSYAATGPACTLTACPALPCPALPARDAPGSATPRQDPAETFFSWLATTLPSASVVTGGQFAAVLA
jgi:hypothetical protein